MENGIFVRCLWGRSDYVVREGIMKELDEATGCKFKIPTQWYCYGEENLVELQKRGIDDAILLDKEPICRFGATGERNPDKAGITNWGRSMWTHKYPPMAHALAFHHDAIWVDLDTNPTCVLPDDLWDRMRQGQPFQCSLRQGSRPRAVWRGLEDTRKTPCGSLMYFRGQEWIKRCLEIYDMYPTEWDLIILSRLVDDMWGGWKGIQAYKDAGFEPYCHAHTANQIFAPEQAIFRSHKKKGLRALGLNK